MWEYMAVRTLSCGNIGMTRLDSVWYCCIRGVPIASNVDALYSTCWESKNPKEKLIFITKEPLRNWNKTKQKSQIIWKFRFYSLNQLFILILSTFHSFIRVSPIFPQPNGPAFLKGYKKHKKCINLRVRLTQTPTLRKCGDIGPNFGNKS